MPRPRKDSKPFGCNIRMDVWDLLQTYHEETSIPKTAIVEKALVAYIETQRKGRESYEQA